MEPEPPGVAIILPGAGADPICLEPESAPGPWTSGAGAGAAKKKWRLRNTAKKESLVVVTKHDLRAIYTGKCDPKKTCIINSLFKNSK